MTLNLLQKLQVYLILLFIKLIYLVDVLTGKVFELILIKSSKVTLASLSLGFIIFIGYSLKTNYLYDVVQAYILPQDASTNINNRVLGASSVKIDKPVLVREMPFPELTSKAYLIVDKTNNKILHEKNSHTRLASASTTKLMTALVAIDLYSMEDEVAIPQNCAEVESAKAGLPQDTVYRVESLLNAMLISSSGDAACALSQGKVAADEFIYRMNQKAYQLKMTSSYFTNPIGLDGLNSSHFSSAQDLYKLADAAMSKKIIQQIVSKKEYTIKSVDDAFIGKLEATNKLLFEVPQTIGVKTGTTSEAGQVLIYEYKDEVKDLLIIVMGSEDRFSDVRAILNWVLVSFEW